MVFYSPKSLFPTLNSHQGWESFFEDEPTHVHNIPLTWERQAELPSWLRGSYIKNGPAQKSFGTEDRYYSNLADSWGKLNKVTFTETGEVFFTGRMIETVNYNRCAEHDKVTSCSRCLSKCILTFPDHAKCDGSSSEAE